MSANDPKRRCAKPNSQSDANAIKRLLRPSVAGYSFVVVSAVVLAIGVGLMLLVQRNLLAPHRDEGPVDVAAQPAP